MAEQQRAQGPRELEQLLKELFGEEELGGMRISEDQSRITANVYIDGQVCQVTYELDPASGHYQLQGHNPLGKIKL